MNKANVQAFAWAVALLWPFFTWADEPASVRIESHPDSLDFRVGPDLVARYRYGEGVAKPYFWPVLRPGGLPLTRAWPMDKAAPGGSIDHPHQKSAWFCHGDVILEGMTSKAKSGGVEGVDFWSEGPGHGRILCIKVGERKTDKNHGWIETENRWQTADGSPVLEEQRILHLYNFGQARLLVVDIDLETRYGALTFGDTKEGSFGIRVNDLIREEKGNGRIENADGKIGEKECWGRVSAWCDYSGTIDGRRVGIAILAHPDNPYPSCWHARGYGLMAANPFGRAKSGFPDMKGKSDLVKLAKGEHLKLRYGLLLHSGDAKEGKVSEYYQRFVALKK
jgi:Methane oxygenase PmoA